MNPTVDETKGEWRCCCPSNPEFDTSINPSCFARCNKCGVSRPKRIDSEELARLRRMADAYARSEAHLPNGLCGCCQGKIGSPWNSGPGPHNLGHETNCDVAIHLNLPRKKTVSL